MRVLVVGGGGREHALCWALRRSPAVTWLGCTPGNPGIAALAALAPVAVDDLDGLLALATAERVDLVVVGPELPLVLGLVDRLAEAGIAACGPSRAAARLEGSKAFTKELCARHGIPTAAFATFTADQAAAARAYAAACATPPVIKADGLAAGKGVVLARSAEEAVAAVDAAFAGAFGDAGATVVVEERMAGEEVSLFALVDGERVVPFGTAQDHKRVGEGDSGPNTGGMGAYAPAPALTPELERRALDEILRPTVAALAAAGTPYRGVLYAGLMLTADGPQLVEYNVRFGDPECQAILPLLADDLAPLLHAAATGSLADVRPTWRDAHALTVVLASRGYPGAYRRGTVLRDLDAAAQVPGVTLFHAGTALDGERLIAAGGRVLAVTGTGATLAQARASAYAAVDRIDWPEGFCRRDIGWRAL